jgi:hypothetical protein
MADYGFTEETVAAHYAKVKAWTEAKSSEIPNSSPENIADEASEHKLQSKIEQHCKQEGFYLVHDRSRGRNQPGQPDCIIALPGSITLYLELKSKTGRLSADQKRVQLMLMHMGHRFYVVKSFRQFLTIVNQNK